MKRLLVLCPNAKLPPSYWDQACYQAQCEQKIFGKAQAETIRTLSDRWKKAIQVNLTKIRDLVQYPQKLKVVHQTAALS